MQISTPWLNTKNVAISNVEARAERAARAEVRTFLSALENVSPQKNNVKQSILIFTWEASLAEIQFCMLPHIAQPERNSEIIRAKHFATAMFYFQGTILFS